MGAIAERRWRRKYDEVKAKQESGAYPLTNDDLDILYPDRPKRGIYGYAAQADYDEKRLESERRQKEIEALERSAQLRSGPSYDAMEDIGTVGTSGGPQPAAKAPSGFSRAVDSSDPMESMGGFSGGSIGSSAPLGAGVQQPAAPEPQQQRRSPLSAYDAYGATDAWRYSDDPRGSLLKTWEAQDKARESEATRAATEGKNAKMAQAFQQFADKYKMHDEMAADFINMLSNVGLLEKVPEQIEGFVESERGKAKAQEAQSAKMEYAKEMEAFKQGNKERLLDLKARAAQIKGSGGGGAPKKPLSAESAKTLRLIASGVKGASDFLTMLEGGDSSLWDTTVFGQFTNPSANIAIETAVETLGRLNSGGAINKDEEARFKRLIANPRMMATAEGRIAIANNLRDFIDGGRATATLIYGGDGWESSFGTSRQQQQQTSVAAPAVPRPTRDEAPGKVTMPTDFGNPQSWDEEKRKRYEQWKQNRAKAAN